MTFTLANDNTIAVDMDSTLYCFLSAFKRSALDLKGIECPEPGDVCEWDAISPFFEDFSDMLECFEHAYSLENVELNVPYEGAADELRRLQAAGYRIEYFTDRPQTSKEATERWLERWDFPARENLNVCADKRGVLKERGDELVTIIDDRPRTLMFARYDLGMDNVFSLRHSYNRNFSDIPGVHLADSWPELTNTILATLGAEVAA